jgi:hypothetical protein
MMHRGTEEIFESIPATNTSDAKSVPSLISTAPQRSEDIVVAGLLIVELCLGTLDCVFFASPRLGI